MMCDYFLVAMLMGLICKLGSGGREKGLVIISEKEG